MGRLFLWRINTAYYLLSINCGDSQREILCNSWNHLPKKHIISEEASTLLTPCLHVEEASTLLTLCLHRQPVGCSYFFGESTAINTWFENRWQIIRDRIVRETTKFCNGNSNRWKLLQSVFFHLWRCLFFLFFVFGFLSGVLSLPSSCFASFAELGPLLS